MQFSTITVVLCRPSPKDVSDAELAAMLHGPPAVSLAPTFTPSQHAHSPGPGPSQALPSALSPAPRSVTFSRQPTGSDGDDMDGQVADIFHRQGVLGMGRAAMATSPAPQAHIPTATSAMRGTPGYGYPQQQGDMGSSIENSFGLDADFQAAATVSRGPMPGQRGGPAVGRPSAPTDAWDSTGKLARAPSVHSACLHAYRACSHMSASTAADPVSIC